MIHFKQQPVMHQPTAHKKKSEKKQDDNYNNWHYDGMTKIQTKEYPASKLEPPKLP